VTGDPLILDGKALAQRRNAALKELVPSLPRPPGLAVVLVGDDAASRVYVERKGLVAERLGFVHRQITLSAGTTQAELIATIDALNHDATIDGILVQLPLPSGLDSRAVVERIAPEKDADGLTSASMGRLVQGRPGARPCTPLGVMRLVAELPPSFSLRGTRAVVLGRSVLVGRPMALLLEQADATVTVCHSRTRDVAAEVRRADIVVAAIGRPFSVEASWVSDGAVLIDVGINRLADGRLVGDIDPTAWGRSLAYTPVPGGVGPMTIATLMENTFRLAADRQGLPALAS
jgi:methylenetetrahydrofolate dehydrogenase (NADP+)/methenyltetrahydrofolate cyclohydrolase